MMIVLEMVMMIVLEMVMMIVWKMVMPIVLKMVMMIVMEMVMIIVLEMVMMMVLAMVMMMLLETNRHCFWHCGEDWSGYGDDDAGNGILCVPDYDAGDNTDDGIDSRSGDLFVERG